MADLELDQVTKVIGYHPRFLDHFLRTQNFIMKGDGPLPYDYRYYLAIIVSIMSFFLQISGKILQAVQTVYFHF
uniref:Uncharacterized protein n=1 Tax=Glossina palpalis gambiensis TaxID=67801 RepID=A0A1B0C756_9MUSC